MPERVLRLACDRCTPLPADQLLPLERVQQLLRLPDGNVGEL